MIKNIYIDYIAEKLDVKTWQVENCITLLEDGNTVPFISRYRKEKTGGLDDLTISEIRHYFEVFEQMDKRKELILEQISSQNALTEELKNQIENCTSSTVLEDIYLPFKPKRRTKATLAKERGLEPLANKILELKRFNLKEQAKQYISEELPSIDDVLSGARDIIAEWISEQCPIREALREILSTRFLLCKKARNIKDVEEAEKYRNYFDFSIPIHKIASHNLLAILRANNEGFISIKLDADQTKCCNKLYYEFCQLKAYPETKEIEEQLRLSVEDAFSRLLYPSLSNEVIVNAKKKADKESIRVFGENLRQLLLASPVGQKRTLAIDPGFRNGCKLAYLDKQGNLLGHQIIYPHPPQNQKIKSIQAITDIVEQYDIEVVAVGNGTASRETTSFLQKVNLSEDIKVFTISEDGASIYSASEVAREEFPNEDVTVRGAVSIGRRLMDPLAELVKIDAKSLGVGQYQYDVDQHLLKEKLDNIVESCVNVVGVDINTASPYLLSYISGIGPTLAHKIIEHRTKIGGYVNRKQLNDVPRLGAKTYEQAIGFLRITGGENPLDNSAVHPEAYFIVEKMAKDLGVETSELIANEELCSKIKAENYISEDFGLTSIQDVISELKKAGRDPREQVKDFAFSEDIHEIEDLKIGMKLPAIVNNITNFGAFADIGIHENGLIHISALKTPEENKKRVDIDINKRIKLHQHLMVEVIALDIDRKRISLKLVD